MSISIQTILENHELRIRKVENNPVKQTLEQERDNNIENKRDNDRDNNFNTELDNIKLVLNNETEKLHSEIQSNYRIITDKYNNLYELHCLMMTEFLKLKNSIEEKDKIELIIEEQEETETEPLIEKETEPLTEPQNPQNPQETQETQKEEELCNDETTETNETSSNEDNQGNDGSESSNVNEDKTIINTGGYSNTNREKE
jgi:hypothetical protein